MPDQVKPTETPMPDDAQTSEKSADKRLDSVADEAAGRALKTEQRYDKDHDIFTK
jgi:hypothetical protein